METTQVESEIKQEMDDSGCIQDDMSLYKNGYQRVNLLDLSDDVLLYILKLCTPRDLKALGFTCARLGSLVLERSLWKHVDARSERFSAERLQWYLTHTLHDETQELMITGHAQACVGCMGLVNTSRHIADEDYKTIEPDIDPPNNAAGTSGNKIAEDHISVMRELPRQVRRFHARHMINPRVVCLSRIQGCPAWGDDRDAGRAGPQACIGPLFTLTPDILKQMGTICPNLTTLYLEHCNVNCNFISLSQFPRSIKKLSLRGTRFFNLLIDRSFLSNISEHLPVLEYLDVSECEWMEPSSLLPLSKHTTLTHLIVRECYRLTEFVAYASLTTRYGFRNLKVIDMRGSPVGDSEVSALGWLPALCELRLAAARRPRTERHAHYADDECVRHERLDDWETREPEYFQMKSNPEPEEMHEAVPSTSTTQTSTEPTEPSTSQNDEEATRLARRNSFINMARRRLSAMRSDATSEDTDESSPPKKRKCNNDTQGMDVDEDKEAENNTNEDISGHLQIPSNVIVVSGIRNPSGCRLRQEPIYCICPEHKDVEKTDKSTETDNMDLYRHCTCVHGAKAGESSKAKEDSGANKDSAEENSDKTGESDKNGDKNDENEANKDDKDNNTQGGEKYVHFRRNQAPVFINCPPGARAEGIANLPGPSHSDRPDNSRNTDNKGTYKEFINALTDYWKVRVTPNVLSAENSNNESTENNNEAKNDSEKNDTASTSKTDEDDSKDPQPSTSKEVKEEKTTDSTVKTEEKTAENNQNVPENQNDTNNGQDANAQGQPNRRRDVQYIVEPRHHVLYVSVGSQLNTYRFPRDTFENRNYFESHVDPSALVTDFAIRRFGRADGEDVNYVVNFGPNGPVMMGNMANSRPDRSNLQVLSVTGYRNITDRSLMHLISAAPNLRYINFTDTNVTEQGVERFKATRPECEVVFSKFVEKKNG
ncbi:unnamed protein product [Colias eurytheme]|nr:unnamed protein product [Colias eurytheme]